MLPAALAAVNLLAFILMGLDKRRARLGGWRIPEKVLFLAALAGGSVGAIAGMYAFRHKTRHLRFVIGLPVILLLHLLIALWLTH